MLRYVLWDVTHTPSDRIQISQVGARLIDRETNMSEVETRLPREEVRTDRIHTHSKVFKCLLPIVNFLLMIWIS